jgi:hypothetical protein
LDESLAFFIINFSIMKRYFLLLWSLIFLFSCSNNSSQELVQSYINVHNTHDIDKALAFYDDTIVFELKNVWVKSGKDAVRTLEEFDAAMNSNLRLEEITVKGDSDSLFCKVIENNDWFKGVGIEDLVHDPTVFVVKNGKITNIIGYPDEQTGKEIEAAIGSIYQWSQANQDSTINELIQEGQFVYSTEAAEKWKDLFVKWKRGEAR